MRKRLLILLTTFVSLCVQAQYEQQWGFQFPENGSFETATALDIGNGYVLTGSFVGDVSLGKDTLHSNGGKDVFILQMDAEGIILNATSFGVGGDDFATDMAYLEGNLFLLGHSLNHNERSLFIVGLDEDLVVVKERRFPFSGSTHLDFLLTNDDRIVIGGSLKGVLQTGLCSIGDDQKERAFCIVLSVEGEVLDTWIAEGTSPSCLHAIVPDHKGGCVLVLNTSGGALSLRDTSVMVKDHAVVLMDLDTLWNPVWIHTVVSDSFVEATSVSVDSIGLSVAINYSDTLVLEQDTYIPSGGLSSLLLNYDWNGNKDQVFELRSDEYCRLLDVCCQDNRYFGTGYYYGTLSAEEEVLGSSAVRNTFLVELDMEGKVVWHTDVGRADPNAGCKMICGTGSLLLTGLVKNHSSTTYVDRFSTQETEGREKDDPAGNNLSDKSLVEAVVEATAQSDPTLKLSPNPVCSTLFWSTNTYKEWNIELFDGQGRCLMKTTAKNRSGQIDLSPFSPGFYTLRFSTSNMFYSQGIIKY